MNSIPVVGGLPEYMTEKGALCAEYNSNYGNLAACIQNTCEPEFAAYIDGLCRAGAALAAENRINGCRFATLTLDDRAVHAMFYPACCTVRIVTGPRGFLPGDITAPGSSGVQPIAAHLARNAAYRSAPGLSCAVTLTDGSFILIDGGPADCEYAAHILQDSKWVEQPMQQSHDAEYLLEYLRQRTPAGRKPVIAAWLFTHAHSDHVNLACDFLERYRNEVEVRIGGLNFPDFGLYPTQHEPNDKLQQIAALTRQRLEDAGADIWIFHTGEKLCLPGCEVEILHTHEDYFPKPFAWGNHSSCAFRLTFGKKRFLVLGDVENDICQQMADDFGAALKCDVLQLTHHGFNGACRAIYQLADPEVCFWPVDGYRFATDPRCLGAAWGYAFNAWLRDETISKRQHYHASETAEIPMD